MTGMNRQFRSTVAVAGIGALKFTRGAHRGSIAEFADQAVELALEDCGLERRQLDGLLVHIGSPRGLDYDEMASLLAIETRFSAQCWAHGRFCGTVLQHAAMAIDHGLADHVVCVGAFMNSRFTHHGTPGFPGFTENLREGGGPHAENLAAGLAAPAGGTAMALRRYLDKYGIAREKLAAVAVAQRKAALANPLAVMAKPLSADDYRASPYLVEPLRVLDCSVPVDTGVAVILTSAARARDLRKKPVYLRAYQGMAAGPKEFVFGQRGLGIAQSDEFDWRPDAAGEAVYAAADATPADIDTFHCYDGFVPHVLWSLERFGFAAPGEAPDWIQNGRIELGGELPVNTSGGHLSEGHSNGWGQTAEIVRQLRGEAGPRQVADCALAMWGTTFGDAIIYASDPH
ncbi:MAG: thiolase family protein [Rhodospirillaceae bacterium]|nr:thiolase family protein [Rhodospirillaceae bacterium]